MANSNKVQTNTKAIKRPKGPGAVTPWHELTRASPVEIGRKFDYVKTRHKNLAKAERVLKETKAKPETFRRARQIETQAMKVENHKAWLMFSIKTLEEHCHYATACHDGSLDRLKPLASGRKRGIAGGNKRRREQVAKIREYVAHCRNQLPAFIACCAVSAGTSAQNEAMKLLITINKSVVDFHMRNCRREDDEAQQLMWTYLAQKAAPKFNPADRSHNLATLPTYFSRWAGRAVEKRAAKDAGPGEIKLPGKDKQKGKFVARASLETNDADQSADCFHPGTYDEDNVTKMAVRHAVAQLDDDSRQFAIMFYMEEMTLTEIAAKHDLSDYQTRKIRDKVAEALKNLLCDFAVN